MEATGGDITASVAAARAAATSVSGSLETKLATEDDISNLRARALSDRFNGDYIAHTDNPAWMRQEADRLRSAGSKSGDYEGQSGLLNAHIMAYERVADAADAEKAARESAAAKAAEKARIEAQESVSVLSADVFSAWSRGQFPGYSLNTLAKSVLTDENIRDNVRLEDIHKNAKKALEQNAPWIAAVFGASDRWMSAKFPNFSKKDYNPTPKEIEEYADASRWAFATEMEIIGNAPYSVLNADAGKMINRLNAALSAKDLGKIDPGNTLKTIQALESGALDNAVALDPNADPYIDPRDSDYVYPNAETKEKYTRFGQQVANLLQSEGVIEKADDVEMRHFPEQGADGRVFGAAGNVYFVDGEGTKYRATAKGKEIVFQRQEEEQDVLTGDWTDIPIREQPKKTGFWEGVKEFFSLPAEPRR
jgi:hypothetical protein